MKVNNNCIHDVIGAALKKFQQQKMFHLEKSNKYQENHQDEKSSIYTATVFGYIEDKITTLYNFVQFYAYICLQNVHLANQHLLQNTHLLH